MPDARHVEIDVRQQVGGGAPHARQLVEVRAIGEEPQLGDVGGRPRPHPAILGHAEPAGRRLAGEHQRRALVHLHDGVQVLGVGERDHPVRRRHRREGRRVLRVAEPGVRIPRGDARAALAERAQLGALRGERLAARGAEGILEQREAHVGLARAVARFGLGHARPRVAPARHRDRGGRGPRARHAGLPERAHRLERLAAREQGHPDPVRRRSRRTGASRSDCGVFPPQVVRMRACGADAEAARSACVRCRRSRGTRWSRRRACRRHRAARARHARRRRRAGQRPPSARAAPVRRADRRGDR